MHLRIISGSVKCSRGDGDFVPAREDGFRAGAGAGAVVLPGAAADLCNRHVSAVDHAPCGPRPASSGNMDTRPAPGASRPRPRPIRRTLREVPEIRAWVDATASEG